MNLDTMSDEYFIQWNNLFVKYEIKKKKEIKWRIPIISQSSQKTKDKIISICNDILGINLFYFRKYYLDKEN